jgi:hypothetical protein
MKSFDGGLLEVLLLTAFVAGVLAILFAAISLAVLLVIHSLEAVDEYKKRKKRGW